LQGDSWFNSYKRLSKVSVGYLLGRIDDVDMNDNNRIPRDEPRDKQIPQWMLGPEHASPIYFHDHYHYHNQYEMMIKMKDKQKHNFFPAELGNLQIVDMMLQHNKYNNCTVLIALMEGGVVSSFEIEHNYSDPNTFYQQQFGEHTIMYGDASFPGQARYVHDMRFRNEVRTTTYE
tara:strand:+ start:86 stop:610 length:525 start_codon:yes stop_codon:yes gene_type:complete